MHQDKKYMYFFTHTEKYGIIGLAVSTIALSTIIYKILMIVKKTGVKNYKELLEVVLKTKNKKLKEIISNIVNIFILITFFIMIAGFGAYFEEQLKINHLIGSTLLAISCIIVFRKSIQGVVKVNEIVIPLLIIFVIIIGATTISTSVINFKQEQTVKTGWLISSFLYAGYNSILLIPVLITLKEFLKSKKQIAKISIITGIITIILGAIIFLTLSNVGKQISQIEMPIAYVISKMSEIMQIIYGVIIMLSIFTTSVSLGNSLLPENKKTRMPLAIAICAIAIVTSNIGFSKLITYAYPIFGILGVVQALLFYAKYSKIIT